MSRRVLRTVSATLVATFAVLASAAALCLLPCELTPLLDAATTGPKTDHCAGMTAAQTPATSLAGTDGSCADGHGWDAPAADRLGSRASGAPAIVVIPPVAASSLQPGVGPLAGPLARAPGAPPPLLVPLRI